MVYIVGVDVGSVGYGDDDCYFTIVANCKYKHYWTDITISIEDILHYVRTFNFNLACIECIFYYALNFDRVISFEGTQSMLHNSYYNLVRSLFKIEMKNQN